MKSYRDDALESTNPLFSELNRLIACLEEGSEVRAAYNSYIQEVCQAQGKSRWRLLKGEARLILGDDCFLIPRKLGREIFYADHSPSPAIEEAVDSLAVQLIDSSPLIKLENTLINEERMSRTFFPSSPLPKALRGWLDTLLPTIAQEEALKLIDQLCSSSTSIDQLFSDATLDSHLNLARALAPVAALPSKLPPLLEAVISQGSPEAFSFLADFGAPIESSLHLMAEKGRSDLIALLSERLGDRLTLDQRGAMGRTALHIAALHGRVDTIRTLLTIGASPLLTDDNLETPLSLALKHGADEVARLLLFYPENLDTPEVPFSETTNRERALQEVFIQAIQTRNRQEQIFYLVKQAFIALEGERPDYWKATLLLNSASAIAQKLSPQCEDLIINQLEQIEHSFIRYEFGREIEYRGRTREYRARLKSIREGVALYLRRQVPIDHALLELTQSYKEVLSDLLNECIQIKGEAPPTRFAMVGLGSMSRNEMCPYSDIEFIFLLEEDNEETRAYFRSITRLMVLKIANFGETDYELPTFMEGASFITQSLTPSGFKMDSALSPLGQRGLYQAGAHELIGTPSGLAEFQADDDKGIILLNAMTTSCLIEGDPDLLRTYQQELAEILDLTAPSQQKRREERALELLKWDVIEYAPRLNQKKIKSRLFGIKKELYRFPQSLINALAIYHGIRSTNTFQRIDRLQEKGVFSITGANQLKRLFRSVLKMRAKTHLFYENEQEVFYHSRGEGDPKARGLFVMTPELTQEITELYRILIPLHQRTQEFLNGDVNAFSKLPFYDKEVGSYDERLIEDLELETAFTSAERLVALDPTNPSSRYHLGRVQCALGQAWKALENYQTALSSLRRTYGKLPNPDIAKNLQCLGNAYGSLGKYQQALKYHQKSLAMERELHGDCSHPNFVSNFANLGLAYCQLGDYAKGIEYYQKSLAMRKELYSDYGDYLSNGSSGILMNLGLAYHELGDYSKAIDYYQQSLTITSEFYRHRPHPSLAMILINLGSSHSMLGKVSEAIDYFNRSLIISEKIFVDRPHPLIAMALMNLGEAYRCLGKADQAIKYHELSLKMKRQIHNSQPHPDVILSLQNLANSYLIVGNYSQALECQEKSLGMSIELFDNRPHRIVAGCLMNLGNTYRLLNNYGRAVELFNSSLVMRRQIHGSQPHPDTADSLNNLGSIHAMLGDYPRAIEYHQQALAMRKVLYEDCPHPNIALSLNNLGIAYYGLNDYQKAIEYHQQALATKQQIHKNQPNPDIADSLNNLGASYQGLKEHRTAIVYFNQMLTMLKIFYQEQPSSDIAGCLHNLGYTATSFLRHGFGVK